MQHKDVSFKPIGVVRSEHTQEEKTPAQPIFAEDCHGLAEIDPEYAEGLKDLEGFSHVYLLYHFHQAKPCQLTIKPFLKDSEHGIFATRAPHRPNAIGISIVELVRRDENVLHLKGVDILNGTPILDVKPYSARFDHIEAKRSGWLDEIDDATASKRGKRDYAS